MTWLGPLLYALSTTATVLAWALALRRPEHRPVAYLLTMGLAADVARRGLHLILHPDGAPSTGEPYTGALRFAWYADAALFLTWPAALAAAGVVVFLARRVWPVLVVYVVAAGTVIAAYPAIRGATLARFYTATELAALLVAFGSAVTWYRSDSREQTNTAQASLVIIIASELSTLVGAWRIGVFDNWHLSQIAYVLLFVLLLLMQGGFVWQSRSS